MKSIYSDVKGRIFNIQRFSVHDGPGIRTIIFLKGCFLRCKWCCNPESQEYKIQTMISNGKEKIVGQDITVGKIIETVKRDMPYYRRSGGGITLSGGECLCQPRFTEALLRECKENGINTAIETTGFAEYSVIEKILPYVDTVLMDIKHIDSQKHKEYTSQPNEQILENARKISENAKELIIRVPVIPGFNDSENEIKAIAEFARSLKGVKRLHLLPYHNFGADKYKGLDRKYDMNEIKPPEKEQMNKLLLIVNNSGLDGQIGG